MLVEEYKDAKTNKNYLIFSSMYGRRVNDALSRAIGYLIGRGRGRDVEVGISDNGFYVAGNDLPVDKALKYLKPENLEEVLKEAIERTDVLARRFRHCATRSLMILRNYKGRNKTVGKQQMKSHFILHAVRKITNEFPILREARREVLEDLMDIDSAKEVLKWIKSGKVKIVFEKTKIPSPFATNLILQGHSDLIRIEDKQDFLKRIHKEHLRMIDEWEKE
jgi:ATP-dependent Lhr-like helicase